ncbi:RNA-directed DNA polymerase, eukaryota, reverse transcriptase zinc-binding domain protein [Tanacetum coccineum]
MNENWMWKSLMDLREAIRKHMQYNIGDGNTTSMWHDRWTQMPAIDTILSRREIFSAGFSNDASIADCIHNNRWKWPNEWVIKYPILKLYHVPMLIPRKMDKLLWCSNTGVTHRFTSNQVWKDIRTLNEEMKWWRVIWFSQNVPRQAFVLWMATKGKLVTHDKLAKWYPGSNKANVADLYNLEDCMAKMASLPCKSSIWSIVRRLCVADTVYHLWIKRNTRIFKQKKKSTKSTLHQILSSVSSRLMTLKVKKSNAVKKVEDRWGIHILEKIRLSARVRSCWIWLGYHGESLLEICRGPNILPLGTFLLDLFILGCLLVGVPASDALATGPKFIIKGCLAW